MAKDNAAPVLFEGLLQKPVISAFDSELRTSDGGATLLAAIDRRTGLTEALAETLEDPRDERRVSHSFVSILRQRVFSIALGYPDGNDSARVRQDPAMKLVCGRGPSSGEDLASQPTLSRFEHGLGGRDVVEMGRRLERFVIDRLKRRHPRARLITIDLDPSVDPTHGQQPLSFFNGHYDTWCYLPMFGFLSVDDSPEQHLFHARLRPGLSKESRGTIPLLRRTVEYLRKRFRKAKIRVRLDAGFAYPQVFAVLDELKVQYLVAMGENKRLARLSERHMEAVRSLADRFGCTMTLHGECSYRTRSWSRDRRVIFKAEVVYASGKSPRNNARYVVTNLRHKPERAWELYCKRGDSENRIKELKNDLEIDRTSCTSFLANQVRVLLTAAAYVLFQELRAATRQRFQVATLRLRLLKIGATIVETTRRVVVSMPLSHPWKDDWRRAATAVMAFL
jgi:hypothetical protein